ncbi:polymer-forming cytoskeletal protein [Nitrospira defluvii]|uniref:DUF8173 domain-containing protein n=1 Tax=Nitrospira defluvii TaxID=330214 RepID=A0ABM8RMM0_9BACT|nr:polymer-forming cytoskeletal protein [Nitrospira defluvii]CAE6761336.1 conserved membrane hypothetical protein [Nitrospira defluvii]
MNVRDAIGSTVLVLLICAPSPAAFADDAVSRSPWGDRAVLRAGQVVQGDYFAFGPHVQISGIVNGDLYAAGGDVMIDGVVNGDVIVAGAKVILSGTVAQDARVIGAQVTVSGTIGRNATLAGVDLHLTETAKVRENLIAGGGHVQLEGPIGRDARVGAWRATLSNEIERDLIVAAESVRLTSKASVGGRLRYWGDAAPSIDEEATVRGPITRRPLPEGWSVERARQGIIGARVLAAVVGFLSTLILGLILLRVYPVFSHRVTTTIRDRPGASLGVGTAVLLVTPIAAASLVVTLLALPVGVVLLAMYGVTVYLARIYTMMYIGQRLLRHRDESSSLAKPFMVGLVVYSLLSLVPVVGGLVTLGAVLFGLGALLITKKDLIVGLREQQQV